MIHPVSTELQCIKTIHKHYYNARTEYDDIDKFKGIGKCGRDFWCIYCVANARNLQLDHKWKKCMHYKLKKIK